jgi:glycosyltransferase involved in cell wall biosynthesis
MIPVTVVVPVKNEETNLPLCLDALHGFFHVVVVDSESTDRTLESYHLSMEWPIPQKAKLDFAQL